MSSTTESTAVFVKMDPQPERIEGGWKMLMFAEHDYPDYVAWSDATDFAAPPKDMTEKIGRALIVNRAPYKPGDTVRERECYRYDDRPTSCQGAPLESQVRVLYPDDPNWGEVDSLLPDGDPLRTIHPAEAMPAWAIRPRVVKSIEPVMRAGAWWWRVEV